MSLARIAPTEVVVQGNGNGLLRSIPADTVVLVSFHTPNAEFRDYLGDAPFRVHYAGNVNGTDTIQAAVHGAAAIARKI
jgi:hypothetical protein